MTKKTQNDGSSLCRVLCSRLRLGDRCRIRLHLPRVPLPHHLRFCHKNRFWVSVLFHFLGGKDCGNEIPVQFWRRSCSLELLWWSAGASWTWSLDGGPPSSMVHNLCFFFPFLVFYASVCLFVCLNFSRILKVWNPQLFLKKNSKGPLVRFCSVDSFSMIRTWLWQNWAAMTWVFFLKTNFKSLVQYIIAVIMLYLDFVNLFICKWRFWIFPRLFWSFRYSRDADCSVVNLFPFHLRKNWIWCGLI